MVINSYFLIVPFVPYCTFAKGTKTSEYVLVYNNSRLCTHCTHLLKKIKKIFFISLKKEYTEDKVSLMASFLTNLLIFCIFMVFLVLLIPIILVHFTKECVLTADKFLVRHLKLLKKLVFRAH